MSNGFRYIELDEDETIESITQHSIKEAVDIASAEKVCLVLRILEILNELLNVSSYLLRFNSPLCLKFHVLLSKTPESKTIK